MATGILLAKVFPDARGSGVPQTESAYHLAGGQIPARVPIGKFITGVLCIGSGHSMGREGPSVQIGAGLASTIGRWLQVPPQRVRELVPVGAAGALAAAFNTPVAAVLFALEEIIGDMNASLIGSTVVASVASVIVERSILGNEPLFHVPPYRLVHPAELIAYAGLCICGGFVSLLFSKGLLAARRLFKSLPARSRILQPAIGGLIIGGLLIISPAVMGVGYEYVDQALNGGLLLKTMVLLCFLKLAATIVSYASGNAGGVFAPSLYIGAMAGGAAGMLVHRFAPFPTADPGAYALVGMGTLFAGIIRAPMTSVFMIFEITQDYQILVPLMVANMLSFVISRRFQAVPLYHALLHQDGIHLPSPATQASPAARTARDLMRTDLVYLDPQMPLNLALEGMTDRRGAYVVGARDQFIAAVTREQLERWHVSAPNDQLASVVKELPSMHVHADHPLDIVVDRLSQSEGVLPVVSRTDAHRVEGIVTPDSILVGRDRQRGLGDRVRD
ncbi:MAG: chloride channel protein [Acidobacteria bacterium]|nr:chloride channel protein [Acidobacteriota bacterium]